MLRKLHHPDLNPPLEVFSCRHRAANRGPRIFAFADCVGASQAATEQQSTEHDLADLPIVTNGFRNEHDMCEINNPAGFVGRGKEREMTWKQPLDESTWPGKGIKLVLGGAKVAIVLVFFFGLFTVIAADRVADRCKRMLTRASAART